MKKFLTLLPRISSGETTVDDVLIVVALPLGAFFWGVLAGILISA